ncbi:MAG: helix-turn-helix transcriptional regulator [Desulfovibrionaceae bacterium]
MAHDVALEHRKYLRPQEVAAVYGLPVRTLELWRQEARGPRYSKAGKYVLYGVSDLETWLSERQVATAG